MIVRLKGGLGNQMFQYAMARNIVEKTGEEMFLDINAFESDILREFELDKHNIIKVNCEAWQLKLYDIMWKIYGITRSNAIIRKMFGIQHEIKEFYVQDNIGKRYLDGYWQNVNYFKGIHKILQNEFKYIGEMSEQQKRIIDDMKNVNSIAMHVRRGDYLVGNAPQMYVNLQREYYDNSLSYIRERITGCRVYVFSDDIDWCKQEFADMENVVFIDNGISMNQHEDFELMRNCKHFIIANSTFSWWASWLGSFQEKIVIAPEQWFCDEQMNLDVQQALLKDVILL